MSLGFAWISHKGGDMEAGYIRLLWLLVLVSAPAFAFDSGSTGSDGALTPNVDSIIELPPSGVLNYSSIDIPSGVTVRFARNALNSPVILLVSGNATIAGSIVLSGLPGAASNGAGNGNVADDGLPGEGGPGGYAGGAAGTVDSVPAESRLGQAGIGPGGGRPAPNTTPNCYGGAGSFGTRGEAAGCGGAQSDAYANPDLLPLVGGSGGSGGNAFLSLGGSGGGGGGGAILIAASGTLHVSGSIYAKGGAGGDVGNNYNAGGTPGGGGSGGAIRLVATTLSGEGVVNAAGGVGGSWSNNTSSADGGAGRIRFEAETQIRTAATNPPYTQGVPGDLAVAGVPTIRISSVGGQVTPPEPTGHADIILPIDAPNPVAIELSTTNVPLGTTISVIVSPSHGQPTISISSGLQGALESATATASVSLPTGPSVLLATLSFSVAGQQQQALSRFTGGEQVISVELATRMQGEGKTTLVTSSGRRVVL
jgi:hypothetical protein